MLEYLFVCWLILSFFYLSISIIALLILSNVFVILFSINIKMEIGMTCIYCSDSSTSIEFEIKPDGSTTDSEILKLNINKYINNFIGNIENDYIICPTCETRWSVMVHPVYMSTDSLPWSYIVRLKLYNKN